MHGLVIKSTGSWYLVKSDEGALIDCKIKGNFRLKEIRSTNPVAVGDRVEITVNPDGIAYINDLEERKNYIIRKSTNLSKQSHILAANLDQTFLFVTVNHPQTSTVFIDRFLAAAEAYRIPVALIFNKIDCFTVAELQEMEQIILLYQNIDYPCYKISAQTGEGVDALLPLLQNKITLLSGNSGVGKSKFINTVAPNLNPRTGNISEYHNKGMHTTTFSEMYEVMPDSYLIDTPGIKGFGTFDMKEMEIGHYFKEIFNCSKGCKYGNCTHTHEPGCAVREAVEQHTIAPSRYLSYLNMLEDENEEKYRPAY